MGRLCSCSANYDGEEEVWEDIHREKSIVQQNAVLGRSFRYGREREEGF